MIITKCRPIM